MSTKLDWDYQTRSGEYHADYKDLVIRAIHDDCPGNPFTEDDGHWPMAVLTDGRRSKPTLYDDKPGAGPLDPLDRFNDAQIIHWQVHIAKLFSDTVKSLIECYATEDAPVGYCTDAGILRNVFLEAFGDNSDAKKFELCAELYKLLDIPCLHTTVYGYSQGDWADVLVVATPEAQKEFGWTGESERSAQDYQDDMERQAKLYKAWAFGDVWGYQLARKLADVDDFEDDPDYRDELVDLDDDGSSCWGYYGSEFDESGLEDAAIEAAEMFVKEQAHV